jgi:hypothetical protein
MNCAKELVEDYYSYKRLMEEASNCCQLLVFIIKTYPWKRSYHCESAKCRQTTIGFSGMGAERSVHDISFARISAGR